MAAALVVCLVVTASSPQLVVAGCGDHLVWVQRSDVVSMEVPFDALWEREMNPDSIPGQGQTPCHGPNCSQRSLPVPSPARVPGWERHDGCLVGLAISATPRAVKQARSGPFRWPTCPESRVFRPPR